MELYGLKYIYIGDYRRVSLLMDIFIHSGSSILQPFGLRQP